MTRILHHGLAFFSLAALTTIAFAETVKDREGAVRNDRAAMEKNSRWIYNDWKKGFEESKKTGRPLMIVLRCVPCLACAGIDAGVLTQPDLQPLLGEFTKVRVINANGLDLSLFQFDYDLSFSTLFFNPDGTVYGRFGSWTHQKNSQDKDTASFKRALESALEIHKNYPANKASLAGKQGAPMSVKDPLQLPELAGKYKRDLDWDGKVVQSCVHCHQVSDAIRSSLRDAKQDVPDRWIYPMPVTEALGITLEPDQIASVKAVAPNSAGAKAGLIAGDELLEVEGQPLISIADVSWILHNAKEQGALSAKIKRGAATRDVSIPLEKGWRTKSDIARRAGTWPMRAMAFGGMQLKDVPDYEREQRGLKKEEMALTVLHVGEYGIHAAANKAGVRKDDVVVAVDGFAKRMTESELIGHLMHAHKAGETAKFTLLRNKERLDVTVPMN